MIPQTLVTLNQVTKSYDGIAAVENISSQLEKGKIVGLVGPDGAGKTTLMRLMAGLLKPDFGSITVDGLDTLKDAGALHNIIGYMPQRFGLYEDLTVIQNLNLYADLRVVRGKEREASYEKLLKFTNLKPFLNRLAKDLSGGMKQKLGLACALVKRPTLLLLDEPSVGVDPLSRRELWKMVFDLIEEGLTVVWSTSYLDEAENCDKTLVLNKGKLIYDGPPKLLTARVEGRAYLIEGANDQKRKLLSKMMSQANVLDGVIQGKNLRIVIREKLNPPFDLKLLSDAQKLSYVSTAPRFEDAYIDLIGEKTVDNSILLDKIVEMPLTDKFMVEAIHLTKKFGNFTAASDISFNIKRGEIFGLLGPNGAGKSTTFKMLCGLLKPTEGESFVNGINLQTGSGEARSQLGYMAQKFSLYGNLSIEQNLNYFAGIYNLSGDEKKAKVEEMIQIFEFQPHLDTSAESLPLGFKQRLALACALMHSPKVLFLDEPTSGVDPMTRREFWNHINNLVEKGVTILVTTHFMDEAEYCDRIALVYRSKVIMMGDPDQLKEQTKTDINPNPTLEEAFITMIEGYNEKNPL